MTSSHVGASDTGSRHHDPLLPGAHRERLTTILDVVGLVARLILGVVLVWAGASKITDLQSSVRAVLGYQLMPSYSVAHLVGTVLPVVEILVGVLLIIGLFTRAAAVVGGLLMVAFIIGIASVWARGISIDCGCFGGGGTIKPGETHYLREILRDTGLLICAAWVVWRARTFLGLDQRLFP
ncbi:MAG TPA: MauE/DoxX family redox-associated membrane protein [Segeticoccus sp.]|uniref:DoxX family protein n=1 Tax=Segeticoccus sp. TaxID=2706531 RepID=UPI002D7F8FDD|nr:MauE/DoxX family redox-associated membrane protein [Segeticoccus sp.]HET8599361.1 MauE/DoxX family redox-associated membrane protein [Segeticoccus sp.]